MTYNITLIPGDGIGPEVTEATRRVLEATGVSVNWELAYAGSYALDKLGALLPDHTLESIKKNRVALKGPVTTPVGTGFRSVNVALRQELDLYACLRPCKIYPGVPTSFKEVDIVVVRENTEDLYCGIEFERGTPEAKRLLELISETKRKTVREDSSFSLKIISETGSQRIVRFAFNYARTHQRKKVTAVHKANIMKFSDGLFLATAREVAKEYPDIEFEDVIVDALCMRLVRNPSFYDVLVLPNFYGDFISDLCAGLVGGLGVCPGANIGDEIAIFEPTHGSAPKYTGQNKTNPIAMMLSGVMMLRHLGETKAADRLERAITEVIVEGKSVTYDLNPKSPVGTSQVADAVIEKLEKSGTS
ncbi:MAG TPA: isocitrate/isopropylmalate dehydrogenase family protein [Dehalococcoidales bacterium]|nr:isocitrate/isopropylmalate dehydrogenase family protein [Dehalococcoidales bacterium]